MDKSETERKAGTSKNIQESRKIILRESINITNIKKTVKNIETRKTTNKKTI